MVWKSPRQMFYSETRPRKKFNKSLSSLCRNHNNPQSKRWNIVRHVYLLILSSFLIVVDGNLQNTRQFSSTALSFGSVDRLTSKTLRFESHAMFDSLPAVSRFRVTWVHFNLRPESDCVNTHTEAESTPGLRSNTLKEPWITCWPSSGSVSDPFFFFSIHQSETFFNSRQVHPGQVLWKGTSLCRVLQRSKL